MARAAWNNTRLHQLLLDPAQGQGQRTWWSWEGCLHGDHSHRHDVVSLEYAQADNLSHPTSQNRSKLVIMRPREKPLHLRLKEKNVKTGNNFQFLDCSLKQEVRKNSRYFQKHFNDALYWQSFHTSQMAVSSEPSREISIIISILLQREGDTKGHLYI